MTYTGELAALATAFLWAFTSMFFTSAGRRIGSYYLNKVRIPMAALLLAMMLYTTGGSFFPEALDNRAIGYLALSGIIGLALGDLCLFSAFVIIGTRLTLLIFALSPIIAALTAWPILGEALGVYAIIGITVTVCGVLWVSSERANSNNSVQQISGRKRRLGILLALGAGAGQAIGLVLAKAGMGESIAPLEATFIRMLAATSAIWLYGLLRGDTIETFRRLRDKKALVLAVCGSVCGPFLGVWMSLVAVKFTSAGIAAAIMGTVPVIVIPLVIVTYKEKVSARAIFGAIITAVGVGLLFVL